MKIAFFIVLTFFAIVGISYTVMSLIYHFLKIKDDNAILLVIPQIDKNFDAEFVLRSVVAKAKQNANCGISQIVCISDNLNEYALKECNLLAKKYEFLHIMTKEQFKEKAGLQ